MNAQQVWQMVHQASRIKATLATFNLKAKLEDRWTLHNVRMVYRGRGAEIGDGTIRHNWRYEISGRTYPVKEILKRNGFRWDPARKVWWGTPDHSSDVTKDLVRYLKGGN